MKRFNFTASCIVLALFLALLTFGNLRLYSARRLGQSRLDALGKEITALEEEKVRLEAQIERTKWIDYLERIARENLNLRKEKETVVAFPAVEEGAPQAPEPLEENKGLWQIFLDKLRD